MRPCVSEMEFSQLILNVPVTDAIPAFALKLALIVTGVGTFETTLNGVVEAGEKYSDPSTIKVRQPVAALLPEFWIVKVWAAELESVPMSMVEVTNEREAAVF